MSESVLKHTHTKESLRAERFLLGWAARCATVCYGVLSGELLPPGQVGEEFRRGVGIRVRRIPQGEERRARNNEAVAQRQGAIRFNS